MNTSQELKVYASFQKILYVEDDDSLRKETINILKRFFMVVKSACNGLEALELYKKENFDIVLTDIRMPKMNGIELAKEIRLIDKKQSIMVMSAHDETDYFIELIKIGIDDFILKPAETEKFLYSMLQVCEAIECKKELEKLQYKAMLNEIVKKDTKDTKKCVSRLSSIAKNKVEKSESIKKVVDYLSCNLSELSQTEQQLCKKLSVAIDEFDTLNDELDDAIAKFFGDINLIENIDIENLINIFKDYEVIFKRFEEFNDISNTISKILNTLTKVDLTKQEHKVALPLISFIYEDFVKFINKVFIEQSQNDIAFFNDSLEASLNEFEIKLGFKESADYIEIF